MNFNKTAKVEQDWKIWLEENKKKGCVRLGLFTKALCSGLNVKETQKILGIMEGAEWLEVDRCVMCVKRNLFTSDECKNIREYIRKNNVDSTVTGSNDNYRKSKTKHNLSLDWVDRRIHEFTGSKESFSEATQGTMYELGGFFKIHGDYFNNSSIEKGEIWDFEKRGQRTWTALIYLNTMKDQGGKTIFPNLNLKFEPEEGTVVCWYNLLPDESQNKITEHIAEPVLSEKFVIQKWYRQKEYL
jgi:hypothetical protein